MKTKICPIAAGWRGGDQLGLSASWCDFESQSYHLLFGGLNLWLSFTTRGISLPGVGSGHTKLAAVSDVIRQGSPFSYSKGSLAWAGWAHRHSPLCALMVKSLVTELVTCILHQRIVFGSIGLPSGK